MTSRRGEESSGVTESLVDERESPDFRNRYFTQFHKTRLCRWYDPDTTKNRCYWGAACRYAHGPEDLRSQPDLRKTSLCPHIQRSSTYSRPDCGNPHCQYAHSLAELRATPAFKKKNICKAWLAGLCENVNCRWAHGTEEINRGSAPPHHHHPSPPRPSASPSLSLHHSSTCTTPSPCSSPSSTSSPCSPERQPYHLPCAAMLVSLSPRKALMRVEGPLVNTPEGSGVVSPLLVGSTAGAASSGGGPVALLPFFPSPSPLPAPPLTTPVDDTPLLPASALMRQSSASSAGSRHQHHQHHHQQAGSKGDKRALWLEGFAVSKEELLAAAPSSYDE
ncbi:unnamed protein product [Vitrella brassicaformis CCMP3155]|uniref:C3H1-type domain-containing protein n=1 Tax=Vitrella brassicaformis (strain CCMP3155) TaxID=1169540 RepID=A0A0G4EP80_VITBC|nr:unnamed protein product [Vitrella brassicaformis CCMP3155]|eukprot:CEL99234.1 unnamed protein product [Vitrella brassicaformis CCMP3155]